MLIGFSLRKWNAVACVVRGDKQVRVCGGRSAGPAVSGHHSWDHLTNQAYPRHHVTPGPKYTHTATYFQKQWHSQGLILAGIDFRNINLWQLFSPHWFYVNIDMTLLSPALLSLSALLSTSFLVASLHLLSSFLVSTPMQFQSISCHCHRGCPWTTGPAEEMTKLSPAADYHWKGDGLF